MRVVHDRDKIEIETQDWVAAQQMHSPHVGDWQVTNHDGDEMFMLPSAFVPRRNGGIDTAQLEALIVFIIHQRRRSFNSGEAYGKEQVGDAIRKLISAKKEE